MSDYDKVVARWAGYIRNVKRRLPVGTRVKPSPECVRQFPRLRGMLGTVVGYGKGDPKVRWDGRKTADGYAPWFIWRATGKAAP